MPDNSFRVEDVIVGVQDLTGDTIEQVYVKVPRRYAIYRTPRRVVVQFADEPANADTQRVRMASLNTVRSQINGLIDGWRYARQETFRRKARRYDARVAAELALCIEDDCPAAAANLEVIKLEVQAERESWGRFEYLISAALFVAILVGILFSFTHFCIWSEFFKRFGYLWLGVKAGAIGAFFSISLAINTRAVVTSTRRRDNVADGALRVLIGAIAGGVLMLMIASGIVPENFSLGGAKLSPAPSWQVLFFMGIVAGFVERFIPNLLLNAARSPGIGGTPVTGQPQAGVGTTPVAGQHPAVPKPRITNVSKSIGPQGPGGPGANVVRLAIQGQALSHSAVFALTYSEPGVPGQTRTLNLSVGQFTITALPTDQDAAPTLFKRIVIDIPTVPPATHPPAWAADPVPPNSRKITVTNPDGQSAEYTF